MKEENIEINKNIMDVIMAYCNGDMRKILNYIQLFKFHKCKENADPSKLIPDSYKLLYQREIILYLRKLATKYCISGEIHQFDYNAEKDISVCNKCGYIASSPILNTDKELFEMYNIIEKDKKDKQINKQTGENTSWQPNQQVHWTQQAVQQKMLPVAPAGRT